MKDVKNATPIMAAEYAIAIGIYWEPAFAWWVPYTIRARARIISLLKTTRTLRGRCRFGIQVPNTIEEAEELDRVNRNDLWKAAIEKELSKVRPAFELYKNGDPTPVGYKKINHTQL